MEDERVLRDDDGERVRDDDGERVLIEEATEDDGERVLMEDEGEQGQFSAAAAGTQNDTGEDAGVWLESERVAAERESARSKERERERRKRQRCGFCTLRWTPFNANWTGSLERGLDAMTNIIHRSQCAVASPIASTTGHRCT